MTFRPRFDPRGSARYRSTMQFCSRAFAIRFIPFVTSLLITNALARAESPFTLTPATAPVTTSEVPPAHVDPTATSADKSTSPAQYSGLVEYLSDRIAPWEPIYFLAGTEQPNVKFQFSLRYQLFNDDGPLAKAVPALRGVNLAYSQTSFWDLKEDSHPFFDNSYRPELNLFYSDIVDPKRLKFFSQIGLITGVQHESNGEDGDESRTMNFLYIRPIFTVGRRTDEGWFLTLAPRFQAYFGDTESNPDIDEYRGFFELRTIMGQAGGFQAAFTGRLGSGWKNGSIQMDLTYPLRKLFAGNIDFYLDLQVFNGFGESLREYNESDTTVRLGVALVR